MCVCVILAPFLASVSAYSFPAIWLCLVQCNTECNIATKVGEEICEILLIQIPSQNSRLQRRKMEIGHFHAIRFTAVKQGGDAGCANGRELFITQGMWPYNVPLYFVFGISKILPILQDYTQRVPQEITVIILPNFTTDQSPEYSLGFLKLYPVQLKSCATHTHTEYNCTRSNTSSFIHSVLMYKTSSVFTSISFPLYSFASVQTVGISSINLSNHTVKNSVPLSLNNGNTLRSVRRLTNYKPSGVHAQITRKHGFHQYTAFGMWWHKVTHGKGSEGETGEWSGYCHKTSERGVSSITNADAHTSAASSRLS